ncbi:hypothetical protein POVWA1_003130 [Plasmodium ovale wallikeri]|uniref:Uncharacterized protein n=1 Tax=Plasmodium ovale wallikeri TaxID=864142 RepID=A0A1A8YGG8_PLAOA|nr:hypothetical protein POVWA1_003130 [Plasmodium ovale wallikeri]
MDRERKKKKKERKIWKEHTWDKKKSLRFSEQHEHCHVVVKDITSEGNYSQWYCKKKKIDSYRGTINNGNLSGDVRRGDYISTCKKESQKKVKYLFITVVKTFGKNLLYIVKKKKKKKKHEYRYASSSSFEKCDRKESDSHQIGDSLISVILNKEENRSDEAEYATRVFTKSTSIQSMPDYVDKGERDPNRDLRLEDAASVVGEANPSKVHSPFVHSEDSCWEGSDSEDYKQCSDGGGSSSYRTRSEGGEAKKGREHMKTLKRIIEWERKIPGGMHEEAPG